ncbi:MAG TPA: hypothetical protein VIK89_02250 [Cytophagaceae bacterium]
MPISGITTNYVGRSIDIHIMQGVDPKKADAHPVTLSFGKISNYCTGIQKLVQRFAILLLTELGSQPNSPEFGSSLLLDLRKTSSQANIGELTGLINTACMNVVSFLRNFQRTSELPADEQIDTAVLQSVQTSGGRIDIRIGILNMEGASTVFITPLPINQ